jgi:hypothetical protein
VRGKLWDCFVATLLAMTEYSAAGRNRTDPIYV